MVGPRPFGYFCGCLTKVSRCKSETRKTPLRIEWICTPFKIKRSRASSLLQIFAFACRFIGGFVQRWRLPLLCPDAYSPRSPSWRPGLATWNEKMNSVNASFGFVASTVFAAGFMVAVRGRSSGLPVFACLFSGSPTCVQLPPYSFGDE